MYEPKGKNYFRDTSKAIIIIYIGLLVLLIYCLGVLFLPLAAAWCYNTITTTISMLSMGNKDLELFMHGFFWSCTGTLVAIGIFLKAKDYYHFYKGDSVLDTSKSENV